MKKIIFSLLLLLAINTVLGAESSFNGTVYDAWSKNILKDYGVELNINSFYYTPGNNDYPWLKPNVYKVTVTDDTNFNFLMAQDGYYLDFNYLNPALESETVNLSTNYGNGESFQFPSKQYKLKLEKGIAIDDGYTDDYSYNNIYLGKDDKTAGTNPIRKYENMPLKIDIPVDPTIFGTAKAGSTVTLTSLKAKDAKPYTFKANPESYGNGHFKVNYPGRFSFFVPEGDYKIQCIDEQNNETECDLQVETLGDKWKVSE